MARLQRSIDTSSLTNVTADSHGTSTPGRWHIWRPRERKFCLPPTTTFDTLVVVRVEFFKTESHGRPRSAWEATRGKRTRIPGTVMAGAKGIPHDLAQYVIEAAAGYRNGFWDLVAKGATFKSTGRRRTKPGRAMIAEHRAQLAGAEQLAGLHLQRWKAGDASPVSEALSLARNQWNGLSPRERLVFDWPSPSGRVVEGGISK
jgi:hypothetical protein